MAGAAGSLAGPLLKDVDFESKLIATSVVGGAASVAGGGKFANGAITAAFGSLFNEAGRAPNERHRQGVEAAAQGYRNNGYVIEDAFLVDVPGLGERVYDFIATDPTGRSLGVEVKTTLWDTIFLNPKQVEMDVRVVEQGAITRSGIVVQDVVYHTYCFNCYQIQVDIQSAALMAVLKAAGISTIYGKLP